MKLRIKPYLNIVQDKENLCYVIGSEKELFKCSGQTVPLLINRVFPLLDGTRDKNEIRETLSDVLTYDSIEELINLLLKNRIVEDVSNEADFSLEQINYFQGVLTLFSRYSSQPFQMLNQMRNTKIAIFGDSLISLEMANVLSKCGVGLISIITKNKEETIQISNPFTSIETYNFDLANAVVNEADIVIGIQDSEFGFIQELKNLNRLCLDSGTPWLHLRLTMEAEGWVGPFYHKEGPCFECMIKRLESNLKNWRENNLYEQKLREKVIEKKKLQFEPFSAQLVNIAALEIIKYITLIEPVNIINKIRVIDFLTQDSQIHTVLKVPYCPACTKSNTTSYSCFNSEEIHLERMLFAFEGVLE